MQECADEKLRIQPLGREQPVLPMMPGIPERRTRNHVRHGRTSLFAGLTRKQLKRNDIREALNKLVL